MPKILINKSLYDTDQIASVTEDTKQSSGMFEFQATTRIQFKDNSFIATTKSAEDLIAEIQALEIKTPIQPSTDLISPSKDLLMVLEDILKELHKIAENTHTLSECAVKTTMIPQ